MSRAVIWLARVLPVLLGYVSLRALFNAEHRVEPFHGPALYLVVTLLAVGLWFLIPMALKREPHLGLLTKGEISMARVIPVSGRNIRRRVILEFRDVFGNPVRTECTSNMGLLQAGTYIPIFYDRENPERCIAACDLNHEIVLPTDSSSVESSNRI